MKCIGTGRGTWHRPAKGRSDQIESGWLARGPFNGLFYNSVHPLDADSIQGLQQVSDIDKVPLYHVPARVDFSGVKSGSDRCWSQANATCTLLPPSPLPRIRLSLPLYPTCARLALV